MGRKRSSAAAGAALLPWHRDQLKASGIHQEVIEARGYRSAQTAAELRRLGFSAAQARAPALVIPLWSVTGQEAGYQARPDSPRVAEGRVVKYELPRGSRMLLDVHPSARPRLGDPKVPLFITEGVKKGDALVSQGACAVALIGVWTWRGTNPQGGRTALPDWEYVALEGRQVYIVFDSDVMLKREVHEALERLAAFLAHRGASVAFIYLPPGPDGAKVGVDDYLAQGHSLPQLLALATRELRRPPGVGDAAGPYFVRDGVIWWRRPTPSGEVEVQLSNFVARIVGSVVLDDGSGEEARELELVASLGGRERRFCLPASRFAAMSWPLEHLGPNAIVSPGQAIREHLRVAIQSLSSDPPERRVITHLGWRQLDGAWAFVHAGGGIGQQGAVPGLEVELPPELARFRLPAPPEGEELREAVRAALAFLEVAPARVTAPLLAAVVLAPLMEPDFSVHLVGATGVFKTELAALAQRFYGAEMDARHLPAGWHSTANALEALAFAAKDCLLVVDDFAPSGPSWQVAQAHREADRLLRAAGNRLGRQRLRSDASLRSSRPPRALILSTGEDVPRGQSLRARLWLVEVERGDVDVAALTRAQEDATKGRYAQAMSAYLAWLAGRLEGERERARQEALQLRSGAAQAPHRRTPDAAGKLAAGLQCLLRFAQEAGAVAEEEARAIFGRCWQGLLEGMADQAEAQGAQEPAGRFLELLWAAIASGDAHVADGDGGPPEEPQAWGWREAEVGTGDHVRSEWRPLGARVGWLEGDDLYLEPIAAFKAAQRMGQAIGEPLAVGERTLHKRLRERGLLRSRDEGRGRLTIRRVLEGARRSVLHLAAPTIRGLAQTAHETPAGPGSGASQIGGEPLSGPFAWAVPAGDGPKTAHGTAHGEAPLNLHEQGGGPDGTNGPIRGGDSGAARQLDVVI